MLLHTVIAQQFFYLFIRKTKFFIIPDIIGGIDLEIVQSCKDALFGNPQTARQNCKL